MFNKDEYAVKDYTVLNNYLDKWILSKEEWKYILESSKENGLDTLVLTDDIEAIKFCKENNKLVDAIEVHAACVNDLEIINLAIKFAKEYNKVFITGISGFEFQELSAIIEYVKKSEIEKVVLMYGFQNFPTRLEDINLSKISLIQKAFGYKVGYADHTKFDDNNKENLINTSYSLGANIQEIHYVLKEGEEKIDYITGVSAEKLYKIKSNLESTAISIGKVDSRFNKKKKKYLNFRKVPVQKKDLNIGDIISEETVVFKRVEKPSKQNKFREIENYFGEKIKVAVKQDMEFKEEHIK